MRSFNYLVRSFDAFVCASEIRKIAVCKPHISPLSSNIRSEKVSKKLPIITLGGYRRYSASFD